MPSLTAERFCRVFTVCQRQQEAKTKSLPSANRSKENEAKELVDRIGELQLQCKSQDEDAAIADAARRAAVQVMLTALLPIYSLHFVDSLPHKAPQPRASRASNTAFFFVCTNCVHNPTTGHGVAEG